MADRINISTINFSDSEERKVQKENRNFAALTKAIFDIEKRIAKIESTLKKSQ